MAKNRNDNDSRFFDEGRISFDEQRRRSSRGDRDYDPYRYPYRERDIDRETDQENDWRGVHAGRDRISRRSSEMGEWGSNRWNSQGGFGQGYGQSFGPGSSYGGRYEGSRHGFSTRGEDFGSEDWRGWANETRDYTGRGPKGYRRSDERIREDVSDALERHPAIDASEIEVQVRDGVVHLSGSVENRNQKRLAEDAVEHLNGVRDVKNELSINQSLFERAKEFFTGESASTMKTTSATNKGSKTKSRH